MNQQEMEVLVNHIVIKQDELMLAIKGVRFEPDFSSVLTELERQRELLEENLRVSKSRNEEATKLFGDQLQIKLSNQKILNQTISKNSELLAYFKDLDTKKKVLKINQLVNWIKRNVAWIAFFSLCVTFCFALYFIEIKWNAKPVYHNLTEAKLKLLDQYVADHPGSIDSIFYGTKKTKNTSNINRK